MKQQPSFTAFRMTRGFGMQIFVGTSGYGYKEWKGKFYPEKIRANEMLGFYAQRLKTVEINNTFYRMPNTELLTSWAEQVPADFVFGFKAPQTITHIKKLKHAEPETEHLFRALSLLEGRLGPILFQFAKSFRADLSVLKDFLDLIPEHRLCSFGFRSPTWLETPILDLLREKRCSLCLEDTDENPVKEIISTTTWGYLRLRRSDYSDADLSQWSERIRSQKWEKAFVYFKHEDGAKGPDFAMRFEELFK